jgi:DNA-binding CsgD family transcriptional regulator
MVAVDDFSRLVAGIYSAAVTPEYWEGAIREIHRAMGGVGGSLAMADGAVWSIQNTSMPIAAARSYAEYYRQVDHVMAAVEKGPVGAVRTGTELILPNRKSEFYAGWMRPNGLEDGLFVRLSGGSSPTTFIVASASRSESFDTPERVKLMSGLVVHFQQALRTQAHLADASRRSDDLAGALDVIRHGVIIVGSDCRMIYLNSTAEGFLRSNDGLHSEFGRIGATDVAAQREFHRALHVALIGGRSGVRGGRSFTCRRPSGKRAYMIHVTPLHQTRTDDRPFDPSALVLIKDPGCEIDSATTLLRRLYGLTKGEAEVALRLARGASLKQISDDLTVSYQTVRTHLQHAFDKTDTHRQGELVHLVLALGP